MNAPLRSDPVQVVPDTPLSKAQTLLNSVLSTANACRLRMKDLFGAWLRTLAFKLNPIGMSSDLIKQLQAVIVKLEDAGGQLQQLILLKKNKNKHYQTINEEVRPEENLVSSNVLGRQPHGVGQQEHPARQGSDPGIRAKGQGQENEGQGRRLG